MITRLNRLRFATAGREREGRRSAADQPPVWRAAAMKARSAAM